MLDSARAFRLLASLGIAASIGLCGAAARAAIVTYEFTGTVLTGGFGGEALTGSFSFDTAAPGIGGHYALSGLLHFSDGAETGLTGPLNEIVILNGESALSDPDFLSIGSLAPAVTSPFFEGASLYMEFFDTTGTAFTNDLLSTPLPPVSAFTSTNFVVREFLASIEFNHFTGRIDSLTLVEPPTVAEPPAGMLLALATIGVAALARRRRG